MYVFVFVLSAMSFPVRWGAKLVEGRGEVDADVNVADSGGKLGSGSGIKS